MNCRPPTGHQLLRLVPGLSRELAAHLAGDDASAFRFHARIAGLNSLLLAFAAILRAPASAAGADFLATEARLAPCLERLIDALEHVYGDDELRSRLLRYRRRSEPERRAIVDILHREFVMSEEPPGDYREKAARYEAMARESLPYADVLNVGNTYGSAADS
jgi:hypothetical protein